jgi:hypothetical protein
MKVGRVSGPDDDDAESSAREYCAVFRSGRVDMGAGEGSWKWIRFDDTIPEENYSSNFLLGYPDSPQAPFGQQDNLTSWDQRVSYGEPNARDYAGAKRRRKPASQKH